MASNIPSRVKKTLATVQNPDIRERILNFYDEISGGSLRQDLGIPGFSRRSAREDAERPAKLLFEDSIMESTVSQTPDKKRKLETSAEEDKDPADQTRYWKKLGEKDVEIIKWKTKVTELQSQIIRLEALAKENQLKAESARESYSIIEKHNLERTKDLEFQLQRKMKEIKELQLELMTKEKIAEEAKILSGNHKLMFSQTKEGYEAQIRDLQTEFEQEKKRLQAELDEARNVIDRMTLDMEEIQNKSEITLNRTADIDCGHEELIKEQQQVIEELQNALTYERREVSQRIDVRTANLEKELAQLKEENRLHRQTASNDMLLQEKIHSLEQNLETALKRATEADRLQSEIDSLNFDLVKWKTLSVNFLEARDIVEAEEKIQNLRTKELLLIQGKAELQSERNAALRAKDNAEKRIAEVSAAAKTESDAETQLVIRRLKKRIEILQKERDTYRTMMDEWTVAGQNTSLYARQAEELQATVKSLEELLKEYQEGTKAESHAKELQQQNESLTDKVKALEEEIEMREIAGNFNPVTTRVLEFKNNPVELEYQKQMTRFHSLEKENDGLKHRLRLMEEGHTSNLTLLVGDKLGEGVTSERVIELEKELDSTKLMNKRMEETFKAFFAKYREALFDLFGYQVDSLDMDMYRLTSTYAEAGENLLFQKTANGMRLMDTPFAREVQELVELHVHQQQSIPVFLSAVTIDLFSKQETTLAASTIHIE